MTEKDFLRPQQFLTILRSVRWVVRGPRRVLFVFGLSLMTRTHYRKLLKAISFETCIFPYIHTYKPLDLL